MPVGGLLKGYCKCFGAISAIFWWIQNYANEFVLDAEVKLGKMLQEKHSLGQKYSAFGRKAAETSYH